MDALSKQTKVLLHEITNGLTFAEKATAGEYSSVETSIQRQISTVLDNCERLDYLVKKEPPNRREEAKLHVDKMKYDCKHLQQALQGIQYRRFQRDQEEKEREQLLKTSFQPNSSDTSIMIDHALQHNTSLHNSNRAMDDLLGSGESILDNLRDQRNVLSNAHKKVLELMNTLGLSNTVMRLIERRTTQDRFILFGGMVLTSLFMMLFMYYFLF